MPLQPQPIIRRRKPPAEPDSLRILMQDDALSIATPDCDDMSTGFCAKTKPVSIDTTAFEMHAPDAIGPMIA